MEGYLYLKNNSRKKKYYCVLSDKEMKFYKNQYDHQHQYIPKKHYIVIGVKDADGMDRTTSEILLGHDVLKHAIVIVGQNSTLFVVQANNELEKRKWLQAMNALNLPLYKEEDSLIPSNQVLLKEILYDPSFDAHIAVTLLERYRNDSDVVSMIVQKLTEYSKDHIDDVEFYLQQIVHLVVFMEQSKTKTLVNLLLSICKSKEYRQNLGNSIHLALQLFWYLDGILQDCDSSTYNQCAELLLLVEAKVVNQHFDPKKENVEILLKEIPGLRQRLFGIEKEIETKMESSIISSSNKSLQPEQKQILVEWFNKERLQRYQYFQSQRDFVKSLTDISERMRMITPPENRKKILSQELEKLFIPENAYLPMGKASSSHCQIVNVLTNEGTVFSTHSRAPCLICFEVVEGEKKNDYVQDCSIPIAKQRNTSCSTSSEMEEDYTIAEMIKTRVNESSQQLETTTLSDSFLDHKEEQINHKLESELMRRQSVEIYNSGLSKIMQAQAFGEPWMEKKKRIQKSSPYGHLSGWNLISLISKSNDDIRQEVFALQLIAKFHEIFRQNSLPLWLRPYRIVTTGNSTGLIETITDAQSLDCLKKKNGYQSLLCHFQTAYGPIHSKEFKNAQNNFLNSLAAYSIVCYILQIKDRHNGNIMLNAEGYLVHIDFGFLLGIAPGGIWSIEVAPFKLTEEMVEVLGGSCSEMYDKFIHLFTLGMLAVKRNADKITILVEIMIHKSTFPCFQEKDTKKILQSLQSRLAVHLSTEETVDFAVKLIQMSYKNKWTKRYDKFQKLTNGIMP